MLASNIVKGSFCALLVLTIAACNFFGLSRESASELNSQTNANTPNSDQQFLIEVSPPQASGYITQRFSGKPWPSQYLSLSLAPSTSYSARIVLNETPLEADILALSSDTFATPITQTAAQSLVVNAQAAGDQIGAFNLELVADTLYRVVVNPDGKLGLPPFFYSLSVAEQGRTDDLSVHFDGPIVSGRIDVSTEPYSAKILQGKMLVSSISPIDSNGGFRILLAKPLFEEDNNSLTLVIFPTAAPSKWPIIEKPISFDPQKNALDLGKIKLAPWPNEIQATVTVVDSQGNTVPNARVVLSGGPNDGVLEMQLTSNVDGKAQTSLLEGSYRVLIIPALNSVNASAWYNTVTFNSANPSFIFSLLGRQKVEGSVKDFTGNLVQDAQLDFQRLGDSMGDIHFKAKTDATGRICGAGGDASSCADFYVDADKYSIAVIPPDGTQLPRYQEMADLAAQGTVNIVLPKTSLINGKISGKSQNPLSNSFVRIFDFSQGEPFLLGESFTDADGNFRTFIAPNQ